MTAYSANLRNCTARTPSPSKETTGFPVWANAVIDEECMIKSAENDFYELFGIDKQENICLSKYFLPKDGSSESFSSYIHERISDPSNYPAAKIFTLLNTESSSIVTASKIPMTNTVLISASCTCPKKKTGATKKNIRTDISASLKEQTGGRHSDHFAVIRGSRFAYLSTPVRKLFRVPSGRKNMTFYEVFDDSSADRLLKILSSKKITTPSELSLKDGTVLKLVSKKYSVIFKGEEADLYDLSVLSVKQAPKEENTKKEQLELMNEILISAGSSCILATMLENILGIISKRLNIDASFICLRNTDGNTAGLVSSLNITDTCANAVRRTDIRSWPHNLTYFAGQPRFVENSRTSNLSRYDTALLENLCARSYAVIPLISDGSVIGGLYAVRFDKTGFTPYEKEALTTIGKDAGAVILRGMIHDRVEKEGAGTRQSLEIILNDIGKANCRFIRLLDDMSVNNGIFAKTAGKTTEDMRRYARTISNLKILRYIHKEPHEKTSYRSIDAVISKSLASFRNYNAEYEKSPDIQDMRVKTCRYSEEIFSNLISYLIKSGGRNVKIKIMTSAAADGCEISILSSAPAMTEEERESLFSDFEDEDCVPNAENLALYTSYTLAHRCGGEIKVSKTGMSYSIKGLMFTVKLQQ